MTEKIYCVGCNELLPETKVIGFRYCFNCLESLGLYKQKELESAVSKDMVKIYAEIIKHCEGESERKPATIDDMIAEVADKLTALVGWKGVESVHIRSCKIVEEIVNIAVEKIKLEGEKK